MKQPLRVPGHRAPPGAERCSCGAEAPAFPDSVSARRRWHRLHREEIAQVPWSDSRIAAESAARTRYAAPWENR